MTTDQTSAPVGAGADAHAGGKPDPELLAAAVGAATLAVGHSNMCDTLADEPCDCPHPALAAHATRAALAAAGRVLAAEVRQAGDVMPSRKQDLDVAAALIERLCGVPEGDEEGGDGNG